MNTNSHKVEKRDQVETQERSVFEKRLKENDSKKARQKDNHDVAESDNSSSDSSAPISASWTKHNLDDGAGMNLFGRDDLVLNMGESDFAGGDIDGFRSGVDHPEIK